MKERSRSNVTEEQGRAGLNRRVRLRRELLTRHTRVGRRSIVHYRPLEASMNMNAYVLKTGGFSWFVRLDEIMNDLYDELH